jgi:hypothetical protein
MWRGCGVNSPSSSRVTGESGWDVNLTTHLNLVPRLRMSGAIPLLPIYAFMACTRTTVPCEIRTTVFTTYIMYY